MLKETFDQPYLFAVTEYERTFLCIDYGRRRVGVAKSDPTGLIASGLTTLEVRSFDEAVRALEKLIAEYEPNGLVIGYPLLASGDKSEICEEVDRLIERLSKQFRGPIHKVDEQYSSREAQDVVHAHGKRVGQDKKRVDRIAAVIILQRFLDEQEGEK